MNPEFMNRIMNIRDFFPWEPRGNVMMGSKMAPGVMLALTRKKKKLVVVYDNGNLRVYLFNLI